MCQSQNVRFHGSALEHAEYDDPPGYAIAQLLKNELTLRGWHTTEIEDWRGCGWSLPCARQNAWLEFSLAAIGDGDEWILQIVSVQRDHAGRAVALAEPIEIFSLAQDVHAVLVASGEFSGFLWCWDDFPEVATATHEPSPPHEN